jgi:hypothetical protein
MNRSGTSLLAARNIQPLAARLEEVPARTAELVRLREITPAV